MIDLYGKPGCGKCEAAKEKLDFLGVHYRAHNLEDLDEWRSPNASAAMSHYLMTDTLPVICIDGRCMSYPEAMKTLRNRR